MFRDGLLMNANHLLDQTHSWVNYWCFGTVIWRALTTYSTHAIRQLLTQAAVDVNPWFLRHAIFEDFRIFVHTSARFWKATKVVLDDKILGPTWVFNEKMLPRWIEIPTILLMLVMVIG